MTTCDICGKDNRTTEVTSCRLVLEFDNMEWPDKTAPFIDICRECAERPDLIEVVYALRVDRTPKE